MSEVDSLIVGPVRESDTLAAWHEVVSATHTELAFSAGSASDFHALLAHQDLGDVKILYFEGSALSAARTRQAVSRSTTGQTMLIWQLSGPGRIRQGGMDHMVAEGDAVFVNIDEPYIYDCLAGFRQIVIDVPTEALSTRLRLLGSREEFQGRPVSYAGLAAPAMAFMRETARQLSHLGARPLLPLRSPFLDAMATVALIAGGVGSEDSSVLKPRVLDFLSRNYGQPKLNSEAIARELGVSRRTLFRAFDGDELGLQGHLLRFRLDASRKMLESGAYPYPVDAVARFSGFSSPSNFAARFAEAFGVTPAVYRSLFLAGAPGVALSER